MMMMVYHIYIDGASKPNPGLSGAGYIIIDDDGHPVIAGAIPLGIMTNNKAEYNALIVSLKALIDNGYIGSEIVIYTDSQLIYGHISLDWNISGSLVYLVDESRKLLDNFVWEIRKIPREINVVADYLSNIGVELNGKK